MRPARDLGGLLPGAMVAPEVIVVERLQALAHGHDGRPRGVDAEALDGAAVDARRRNRPFHRLRQRGHVVGMTLRGVFRIFLLAMQRIFPHAAPQPPLAASTVERWTPSRSVLKSTPTTMLID